MWLWNVFSQSSFCKSYGFLHALLLEKQMDVLKNPETHEIYKDIFGCILHHTEDWHISTCIDKFCAASNAFHDIYSGLKEN